MTPLVSVVMATRNRRALLEQTLPWLFGQDHDAAGYEVIIVVDGATDDTAAWARGLRPQCAFEVLEIEHGGPAVARNHGIGAASGDLVLFLDDDIRCDPSLVREHALGHDEEAGILVHGALALAPESPRTLAALSTGRWYDAHNASVTAQGGLRPDRNVYLNANSSVPAHILRDLGGFDEQIPFPREDFELGLRIWKAGVPLRYRPTARAYEVFTKSTHAFAHADGRSHARADVLICRKHPEYRPSSPLAAPDGRGPARLLLRRALLRLPPHAERILDPPVQAAERLADHAPARELGLRLLALQRGIVTERAARDVFGSARALEAEFDRRLPVLLYHRVGEPRPPLHPDLTVSPGAFERHIAWLARRGYTGIGPSAWRDWREGRDSLPRKPVLITFDDGYADLAEHALPVLRRHGFGALVFVVTGRLGQTDDWDPHGASDALPRLATAGEIVEWAARGVEFGAHGRTHRDLTTLDGDHLDQEIRGSRADLEELLGTSVISFAYPFGRHDAVSRDLVSQTYELAFTTEHGLNGLATPPHLLRRMPPAPRMSDFAWRLATGRQLSRQLLQRTAK